MSCCKGCGAPVVWIKTQAGKPMPLDPEPVLTIVTDDGRVVSGRTSHFATCPQAQTFRKASNVAKGEP